MTIVHKRERSRLRAGHASDYFPLHNDSEGSKVSDMMSTAFIKEFSVFCEHHRQYRHGEDIANHKGVPRCLHVATLLLHNAGRHALESVARAQGCLRRWSAKKAIN